MKAVQEPCEVTTGPDGRVKAFTWRGKTHRVTRELDRFRAGGRWWLGEPVRSVHVLECGPLLAELCEWAPGGVIPGNQGWWVMRVQD